MPKKLTVSLFHLAIGFLMAIPTVQPADAPIDPAVLYDRSVESAEAGDIDKAIELMEAARSQEPQHPDILWNLGIWYSQTERHAEALRCWQEYLEVDPEEWRARAKLIQAYQALGNRAQRDEERSKLLDWYHQTSPGTRPDQDMFCREQFSLGDRKIMAFEYFEPQGERKVFYQFSILDSSGDEQFRLSLGSYDITTDIARETGTIGPDDRLYHLDEYGPNYHRLYGFVGELLDYEELKAWVIRVLQSETQPLSGTEVAE